MALAAVAVVLAAAGCTSSKANDPPPAVAPGPSIITVSQRDIYASVTLDATTNANTQFVVLAPVDGRLSRADSATAGSNVAQGQALGSIGGKSLTAPVAATVVRWLVDSGSSVGRHVPVAVLSYHGFTLSALVPGPLAYRFYTTPGKGRALIHDGPGPFDCVVLYGVPHDTAAAVQGGSPTGPPIECAVPPKVEAFPGLTGLVSLRTGARTGVLALPVSAVAGSADSGAVYKVDSTGKRTVVEVKLGLSDGTFVEITSGLAEGDRVSSTPPALRPGG